MAKVTQDGNEHLTSPRIRIQRGSHRGRRRSFWKLEI